MLEHFDRLHNLNIWDDYFTDCHQLSIIAGVHVFLTTCMYYYIYISIPIWHNRIFYISYPDYGGVERPNKKNTLLGLDKLVKRADELVNRSNET